MSTISKEAKLFLKRLLQREADKRPSAHEALKDPWILKNRNMRVRVLRPSLSNLHAFSIQMSLQKAVLSYMASQQLSKEEEERIKNDFAMLDVDQDGCISTDDLIKGFLTIYGDEETAKKEARKIMEKVDINQSGSIDYNGKLN